MFLWLIWDTKRYPAYPFLKKGDADMDMKTVHKLMVAQDPLILPKGRGKGRGRKSG